MVFKMGIEASEDIKIRFLNALANGKKVVSSIQQAERLIQEALTPTVIQFSSLSLGAEDKMYVDALINSVRDRDIYILYDEADMIQTKDQRVRSTAAMLNIGRKRN